MRTPLPVTTEPPATTGLPADPAKTPLQIPPWVQKAIDMHKAGQAMRMMWVHPELAADLENFYGKLGHVIGHDDKIHGILGLFTNPPNDSAELPVASGDKTASAPSSDRASLPSEPGIEPTPIPGAGSGHAPPPTPTQRMINGLPISSPEPSTTASGNDPQGTGTGGPGTAGSAGAYGFSWVGPGIVYGNAQPDGTQLAYPTYSYRDPNTGDWIAHAQLAGTGSSGVPGGTGAGGTFGGGGSFQTGGLGLTGPGSGSFLASQIGGISGKIGAPHGTPGVKHP